MNIQYLSRFDFQWGIKRIKDLFNAIEPYNDFQADWLYKVVRLMNIEQWEALINQMPGAFDRMPTIKQVVDIARQQLVLIQKEIVQRSEDFYSSDSSKICKYCLHTGKMSARPRNDPKSQLYVYGTEKKYTITAGFCFRCPYCEFAELHGFGQNLPLWKDSFAEYFEFDSIKSLANSRHNVE